MMVSFKKIKTGCAVQYKFLPVLVNADDVRQKMYEHPAHSTAANMYNHVAIARASIDE
jgi:hypothetical protein